MAKRVLAMDYGASSGRGIIGIYDGSTLKLEEIHRFSNEPVVAGRFMYWDVLRLLHGLKQTLSKAELDGGVDSLSIDTWGVDFGLLDAHGDLISNPIHYRDPRVLGMQEKIDSIMSPERLFSITGLQAMEINTLVQLYTDKIQSPKRFEGAKRMLMMPDLLGYFLTGEEVCEYSIASTSQMMDAKSRDWSPEVLDAFGISRDLLPSIVESGTVLGEITDKVKSELMLHNKPQVICGCGHDTEDAMVAVPTADKDFAFISVGTWALFGTELDEPVLTEKARKFNLSNEGGYGNKTAFLKNITGTWIIQESRRQWKKEGHDYGFGDLEKMAAKEKPFVSLINPDAPEFAGAGDMPAKIRDYCHRTCQPVPETPGAIVRCIDESLALAYRATLEDVAGCTGKAYNNIYLVGGGSQSALLCKMSAEATGKGVYAGPVEATVLGNIVVQLMTQGELSGVEEARDLISRSQDVKFYEPKSSGGWDEAFGRYKELL